MDTDGFFTGASGLDIDGVPYGNMPSLSPAVLPRRASTPASSERSHTESISSSDYAYSQGHHDMSFQTEEEAMEQMFLPPSLHSSHQQPFYPTSTQPMFPYTTQECYPDFNQQAWTDLPLLGPQQELMPTDHVPPSSIFPAFDTSGYGMESTFIPPAPQSPFAFENSTHDQQPRPQSYLSPPLRSNTHSSQTSHHSRTASSLSRSCSPSLSLRQSSTSSRHSSTTTTTAAAETTSLLAYGIPIHQSSSPQSPTWRCAYPGCTSRALFTRGCDLRKHFNRHSKHLFCRVDGCPQSETAALADSRNGRRGSTASGGFSSKKDRARHEAKHNPGIRCEWQGPDGEECGRVFSRMDNMKDHVRRIHRKGQR